MATPATSQGYDWLNLGLNYTKMGFLTRIKEERKAMENSWMTYDTKEKVKGCVVWAFTVLLAALSPLVGYAFRSTYLDAIEGTTNSSRCHPVFSIVFAVSFAHFYKNLFMASANYGYKCFNRPNDSEIDKKVGTLNQRINGIKTV